MKKTLMMTYLLAVPCMMVWLKSTVHAQDQAGAQPQRSHNRAERAIPSFFASPVPPNDASDNIETKVQRGFDSSPVPLNLDGKDLGLVGLGSYLVNIQNACNDCHSAGPATQYLAGGNPFFGQPKMVNPAVYLGGGRDFGALIPGTASIVSRNLTPDKTGLPEGGHTFDEFLDIIRTGADMDHLHPNCTGAPNENCLLRPFDGNLLQIMPWPVYQGMTDRELRAIYEYLSAIPCVAGPPAPSLLHNDCN
jgi:hypothetical protein